ncbi:hypothetical protein N8368_04795 [Bacteroidia bacterium]|nr:hypothetical protein [Bacteroidia bacterium]MDB9882385.1 hypothetical protein [Bacteroidia bacterium]MDC1395804.1 hypothetical protein [Bacteroidia bacterium]
MKKISKSLILMLLSSATISFVGCTDDEPVDLDLVSGDHSGFISEDETWSADVIHTLKDRVVVKEGVTLTIEPGTIVKGESGTGANASVLVIARGATINAAGTADNPIIFTSTADEIGLGQKEGTNLDVETAKGFWGGVIILGDAPISPKTGATEQVEGIPADVIEGNFGGSNAEDNSGVLTYISIRHGGTLIGEGNEINGLTLGGVGNGTTINHIEVVGNVDDGIECFGGTVNIDHAIVMYQGDDAYDIDQAYSGTINNFIYIAGVDSDHGLEIDGPEGSENAGGQFTLTNGSLKGNATQGEFADFRSGAQGLVDKLYFFGFNSSADMELDDDKTSANYIAGALTLTNLKFSSTAWSLDGDGKPDGATTTWTMVTDLFSDKSEFGDEEAADASFSGDGNALVTEKVYGADISEFTGWTLADTKGLLADF